MKALEKYKKLSLNDKIFYGLTILSIGLWIIVSFGAVLACLIVTINSGTVGLKSFLGFIDFGDFFYVLNFIKNRAPYLDLGANYPPLAYLILYPFSLLAGADGTTGLFSGSRAIFSLALFFIVCLTFITILVYKLFKGEKKNKRILFVVFSIFSFPVLYLLLRANVLLVTLIFVLFFINYYKSENRVLKELAILALAIAVAIKLYPVFFAILLVRERRFLDCLKAAVYTVILFFLPFLFFEGGFSDIRLFINNLIGFADSSSLMQRDVSIGKALKVVFQIIGVYNDKFIGIFALVLTILITGFSAIASLFLKKIWKVFLLLALMCVTAPLVSFGYSIVFLIPSIAFFLKEEKNETDTIFAVLFFVLFSFTGFFLFINSFIVLAIQIALIIQAFDVVKKYLIKAFVWARDKLDKKLKFLFVCVLGSILGAGISFVVMLSYGIDLKTTITDAPLIIVLAVIASNIIMIINNYFWNKYFIFKSKEKNVNEKLFIAVYVVAICVDIGLKIALNTVEALNQYLIVLIGIVVVAAISYFGQRFFVFKKAIAENKKEKSEESESKALVSKAEHSD